ncbi:MAG: hypothetical protein K2L82_15795 [Lachnospiraceae bacterium]|nr:hypothetical protein [Lachnospiraceae bacterium]
MKNPKGGRSADYTKEQLLEILLQYTKEHPDQTVRLFELEAATGIKRYVWSYNMKEEIDEINRELKKVDVARTGISLPSAEQILTSCKGDEEKLAMQIQTLIEMVQDMSRYQDAAKTVKEMQKDYENKLDELNCIIKEQDKKIEELFTQINRLAIDSENPNMRKEKGITNNIIEFTPKNMEEFKSRAEKLLL